MKAFLLCLTCYALLSLTGCATIVNEKTQNIRVDTYDAKGKQVNGAQCKLTNDYGDRSVTSSGEVAIHRSSDDLLVECSKKGLPVAKAVAISRGNTAIYGNILAGGLIGAAVDHGNGKGYSYPQWLSLVFGRTLTFDRKDDKEGQRSVAFTPDEFKLPVASGKPAGKQLASADAVANAEVSGEISNEIVGEAAGETAGEIQDAEFQVIEFRAGVSSTTVERLGKDLGCEGSQGAGLITDKGPVEIYRMQCKGGKTFLARCELRQCKPLR